jgi:hypothetical protein
METIFQAVWHVWDDDELLYESIHSVLSNLSAMYVAEFMWGGKGEIVKWLS